MGDTPSLGPAPERTVVGSDQVRRLVEDQFPQWADLKVEPVGNGGWDNWTFHLGSEKVVRLPSAAEYAQAVDKEHRWLPVLAPRLPLPIPVPLAKGAPSADYPHPVVGLRVAGGQDRDCAAHCRPARLRYRRGGLLGGSAEHRHH
jgi:aminoglycoside phosphotransferase (APT) family kinase protein